MAKSQISICSELSISICSQVFIPFYQKENKSPIIFLHGMLCSKEIWGDIPQTVATTTGRKVYTYDARNHGKTIHKDKSKFSFSLNVDDLFIFIKTDLTDHNGQLVLVGHDMGGMTAIHAALKEPSAFEMVFIVEMFAKPVSNELIKRARQFMSTWTKSIIELPKDTSSMDVTRKSVESLYEKLEDWMKEDEEKESYLNGRFEYMKTGSGYDAVYNAENLAKALDDLEKHQKEYQGLFNGPAFFIYGTKSHYKVNEETDSMKKHFPKAELIQIENGSHFLVANKSAELAKIIGDKINAV